MTYPINSQTQQIPGYSGITINIANPNISSGPQQHQCPPNHQCLGGQNCLVTNPMYQQPNYSNSVGQNYSQLPQNNYSDGQANIAYLPPQQNSYALTPSSVTDLQTHNGDYGVIQSSQVDTPLQHDNYGLASTPQANAIQQPIKQGQQAYPAEYYINNYNYVQNSKSLADKQPITPKGESVSNINENPINEGEELSQVADEPTMPMLVEEKETDLTSSKNIINDLDSRLAEQKKLEKNGKKTRVVALTNEYIMSLENYLNNPNTEIRLMAAKEILTRLDEDKDRFDDAALNALLNKMLQDPEKLVRVAALSAFTSELASGNDYTVKLLNDIQSNPNADKEDIVDAANILLKMSAATEVKYLPQPEMQQAKSK